MATKQREVPADQRIQADFAIEIDFERGSESPSRVFRTMTGLIEAFEQVDQDLTRSIDVKIKPVLLLEDVQAGSVRAWLRSVVKDMPDDALAKAEWKPILGTYLVKAKRAILNWTDGKTSVTTRQEIVALQQSLTSLAEETQINRIPAYAPPDMRQVLGRVQQMSDALEYLRPGDRASFGSNEGDANFNLAFHIVPETLDALLTERTITNRAELLLKVKKPDYLGDSRWELRHGSRTVPAKIEDVDWLRRFQSREVNVRPGDALWAKVRVEVGYGHDGELVGEHFFIEEVLQISEPGAGENLSLLPGDPG